MSDDAQREVRRRIHSVTSLWYPPLFFVEDDLFYRLVEEVEPNHREQYGALVVSQIASEAGFESVMFLGVGVCCTPKPSEMAALNSSHPEKPSEPDK